ncbi:MAG: nickel pincer cofactor biosynthesis protein LarB [Nitrososphaerales archaeon]
MKSVSKILRLVRSGKLTFDEAEKLLRLDTVTILGDLARVDSSRFMRRGVPEIIYGAGKTEKQLSEIVSGLLLKKRRSEPSSASAEELPIIISKVSARGQVQAIAEAVKGFNTSTTMEMKLRYYDAANIITISGHPSIRKKTVQKGTGRVALICAGTSDISALNEAEVILDILGCDTIRFNDVGVAALHRIKEPMRKIMIFDPDVIIVAAGMEGALPSVIAGLSSIPVVGLPTSVGYGFGGRGEAALMSMLQACPLGMAVVNIDAGIAAGIVAYLICKRVHKI